MMPASVSLMAKSTGITNQSATAATGRSRCVLENRLFGHLIIFFYLVQGRVRYLSFVNQQFR